MTISTCTESPAATCPSGCAVDPALRAHHDRMLTVAADPEEMVELFELAVTWGELEYGRVPLIDPSRWVDFALQHDWADPQRALRIFSLATDIAARAVPASELMGEV